MRALILFALLLGGCRQQWTVYVVTNVVLPIWGDRVLVEVFDQNGQLCDGCRREFEVTKESFPLTFGVAPPDGNLDPRLRVRGRLYRSSQLGPDGLPTDAQIDFLGILPSLRSGSQESLLPLLNDCYKKPSDLAAGKTCRFVPPEYTFEYAADIGEMPEAYEAYLELYKPGSAYFYEGACSDYPTPAGMACLPVEGYLMGSARSEGVDTDYPPVPEVIQQPVFPLYNDRDEMTVGTLRTVIDQLPPGGVLERGRPGVPAECTYQSDGSTDELPVNCISVAAARAACAALGKYLPSESDWEHAARNGARGTRFPWGEEPPTCERSWVSADPARCPRTGPTANPPDGDVSEYGIRNLGGNLSEWTEGTLLDYTAECWNVLLDDRACFLEVLVPPFPHRGGSWDRRASSAAGFARFASYDGAPSPSIGLRCAYQPIQCPEICQQLQGCSPAFPDCLAQCQALTAKSLSILRFATILTCPHFVDGAVQLGLGS
jgi:hypothetical protein